MATITRHRVSLTGILSLTLAAAFGLTPLVSTGWFSFHSGRTGLNFDAYLEILEDPAFHDSLLFTLEVAFYTIALTVTLATTTAYWVQYKYPRLRPAIEFIAVMPIVIPPIILVTGLLRGFNWAPDWFYGTPAMLVAAYVALALPYSYSAIESGLHNLNVAALTEAARSLGASWPTVIIRLILPNLRSSMLSASFLTFGIVMGEFTVSLVMQFTTFAVYTSYVWESQATGAAALSIISFLITWLGMIAITFIGKRAGQANRRIGGVL